MTEQTNAELIDKLRIFAGEVQNPRASLMRDAADALEAADQRAKDAEESRDEWAFRAGDRDALEDQVERLEQRPAEYAAVVEKVREVDKVTVSWENFGQQVRDILYTSAPADALRELKAEVWEEGFARSLGDDEPINPYRREL